VCSSSTTFIVPFSEGTPFKDLTGFTFISNFGSYVWPLLVRGDSPWHTLGELIEWAKKNPRGVKVGLTGAKFLDYKGIVVWQIEQKENVEFTYLAFKGSPEANTALLGGHINLNAMTVDATTMSYVKEGKMRILAYSGKHKVPGYENLPTAKELYGIQIPDFLAVIGPKGLPDYVVKRLDDAFSKATKEPSFINMMDRMSMPVMYMDHDTVTRYADEQFRETAKIYEKIKAEEAKRKK
jgi:tripartite-type tricarboxylate transporter receptor subunit TctC